MGLGIESVGTVTFFKQASCTTIDHPDEVTNCFTVRNQEEASEKLAQAGIEDLSGLDELLKDIDFASVSTRQLKTISLWLADSDLYDRCVTGEFISGNADSDIEGNQINLDVKFNAIALFHQTLNGHNNLALSMPILAPQEGFKACTQTLTTANHVLSALVYYANAGIRPHSVDERA
ncbi:Uncharacterised protein [Paucimonas lemoignei]|jgi:hypothetical protein|nr:Uncharacterised protein [Paucimonas lemoignei]